MDTNEPFYAEESRRVFATMDRDHEREGVCRAAGVLQPVVPIKVLPPPPTFCLQTHEGGELDAAAVVAARDAVLGVIDAQLTTFPGGVRDMLVRELGADRYQRLLRDLAGNVCQGLL